MIKGYNVKIPRPDDNRRYVRRENDVLEFLESGTDNCEVEVLNKSIRVAQSIYINVLNRLKLRGSIKCVRRNERLFLVKINNFSEKEGI